MSPHAQQRQQQQEQQQQMAPQQQEQLQQQQQAELWAAYDPQACLTADLYMHSVRVLQSQDLATLQASCSLACQRETS